MWANFYIEKPTDILENLIRHCTSELIDINDREKLLPELSKLIL